MTGCWGDCEAIGRPVMGWWGPFFEEVSLLEPGNENQFAKLRGKCPEGNLMESQCLRPRTQAKTLKSGQRHPHAGTYENPGAGRD